MGHLYYFLAYRLGWSNQSELVSPRANRLGTKSCMGYLFKCIYWWNIIFVLNYFKRKNNISGVWFILLTILFLKNPTPKHQFATSAY